MTVFREQRVLVSHPGGQHSGHVAQALSDASMLAAFWTGNRRAKRTLPAGAVAVRPIAPLLRRVLGGLAGKWGSQWGDYLGNRLFDRWAASRIRRAGASAVIGYEVGCGLTFEVAREIGARTILDAASLHFSLQEEWTGESESRGLRERIVELKSHELSIADHILVGSSLAENSYRKAGFAGERISVVPLGVDLEQFRPGTGPSSSGLAVLFVGKMSVIKGFDLLIEAFLGLRHVAGGALLRVAGQGTWSGKLPDGVQASPVEHRRLAEVYCQSDVLVVPSRMDGFGMVVSEALACGTPVIVSDHVGAKDLVREGENGWIVPANDVGELAGRLRWCSENLETVRSMRDVCRASVEPYGWAAYGSRLVAVVRRVLEEHGT